jgi:predicted metal-binding protein
MAGSEKFEKVFAKHDCVDFKWFDPKDIVISHWVRMKCRFGCEDFGHRVACPPNLPSIPECEKFFSEFDKAVLFHFERELEDPEDRHEWTREIDERLFAIEREIFLSGYHKAFVIYVDPCDYCGDCVPDKRDCKHPRKARPSLEGLGVDVFATVRKCGYEIEVLSDYYQRMNRYGMLLIE